MAVTEQSFIFELSPKLFHRKTFTNNAGCPNISKVICVRHARFIWKICLKPRCQPTNVNTHTEPHSYGHPHSLVSRRGRSIANRSETHFTTNLANSEFLVCIYTIWPFGCLTQRAQTHFPHYRRSSECKSRAIFRCVPTVTRTSISNPFSTHLYYLDICPFTTARRQRDEKVLKCKV